MPFLQVITFAEAIFADRDFREILHALLVLLAGSWLQPPRQLLCSPMAGSCPKHCRYPPPFDKHLERKSAMHREPAE